MIGNLRWRNCAYGIGFTQSGRTGDYVVSGKIESCCVATASSGCLASCFLAAAECLRVRAIVDWAGDDVAEYIDGNC